MRRKVENSVILMALVAIEVVNGSHRKMTMQGKYGKMGAPHIMSDSSLPIDHWFTQRLDHFDSTNQNFWQQRYQVVSDYYVEKKPVFLMISGEGEANPAWMVYGNWVNYAKENNALMFQLEHRYYGLSHPTSDLSLENLRHLSSEQALADIAYFISTINALYNLHPGTKWIVFGGSYAGNLAAWARLKYPHLIHGAMSASGPVLAKVYFYEYMDVVNNSLATYDVSCPNEIKTASQMILQSLKSKSGPGYITNLFRLCDTIDPENKDDVYSLMETLADNIAGIVQYNKDNRGFNSTSWNITIDTICDIMVNTSIGNAVQRYAAVNSLLMDTFEETCIDYEYDTMINELKDSTWESLYSSFGARQWMYQTCTEFGYYQTSENKQQLFGNAFPLQYFLQQCTDIFGENLTRDYIFEAANRTNIKYGGLNCKATRVVYVHGTIDPWHALGITHASKEGPDVILINGTAHCANMYPPRDTDLPALKAAREKVGMLIQKWIQDP